MFYQTTNLLSKKTLSTLFCVAMLCVGFSLVGVLLLPVGGAILAFLCRRESQKRTWLLLVGGIAISYLTSALLGGLDFANPIHALNPLLVLAFALPLFFAAGKRISRTAVILVMTVCYGLGLLAVLALELLFVYRAQAWVQLWQMIAAIEAEFYNVFSAVTVGEERLFTDEVIRQALYAIKALLPACYVLFSMGLAYIATVVYRFFCEMGGTRQYLSAYPYEITVSPATAIVYLPFACIALFFSGGYVTAFWTVTQTISLLLAPGLAYCQLQRVFFRIRNRQMDSFSWICFGLFFLVFFADPLGALRLLGIFGAYRILMLAWDQRQKKKNGEQ